MELNLNALELLKKEIFLEDDTLITSKTDLKGKITYGNLDFIKYVGYKEEDFLGKPHNLVRHPFMPRTAFKLLWDTLHAKKEFFAYVCNRTKTGTTYWVFTNVTPSFDEKGNVIGYYSVRRRSSKAGVEASIGVYKKLLEIEKNGTMEQGVQFVTDFLEQNQITWGELMANLQAQGKAGGYR